MISIKPKKHLMALSVMFVSLAMHGCATMTNGSDAGDLSNNPRQAVDREAHFSMEPLFTEKETAERLRSGQPDGSAKSGGTNETAPTSKPQLEVTRGPSLGGSFTPSPDKDLEAAGAELTGPAISVEVNNLPLPVFINEVFGEKLGLSYSLAPELATQSDLVTLRLSDPLEPAALFRTARNVLADYGVAITRQEGVWSFTLSDSISTDGSPLLITGGALPDVPVSHRPVFQAIELKVVRNNQVRSLVQNLFKGQKLEVSEDPMRNAIILKGPADVVADAAEAIDYFDQPVLKGQNTLLLRPAYREIPALAKALSDLLSAQGYGVGSATGTSGSVILLPMPELEVIVVLANDNRTLAHVQRWAAQLDNDYQQEIERGMFIYEVQNTSAESLANLVKELYNEGGVAATNPTSGNTSREGSSRDRNAQSASRASGSDVAGGRLVVDNRRNVLIYRGSGSDWLEIKDILEDLDKQVPSVLLEVLLAEVTLNDGQGLGVEWLARNGIGDLSGTLGTLGGLGIGGRGFSYTLNSAGQTRAVLNAFYDSNQAVIRSSPKIMVKSGETARIEVGNEIPVITSTRQNDTTTGGDTDVLQQFQYRQTGVNLQVAPVVQASGLVDIKINQTLSETQDTGSGDAFLPTILNRSVETSLTLRDGGSVVLGGLISRTSSQGEQGVPWLGKLPLIGQFFRVDSQNNSTTELLVMVVPYVIRDDQEAKDISDRLRNQIGGLEFETSTTTSDNQEERP
jgi:general secretion pathway protein D